MLLPKPLGKLWIYQVLPFIVSQDTSSIGNKIFDRNFFWSADHGLYFRLGSWNCKSDWPADDFVRKLRLLHNESSLEEKIVPTMVLFPGTWKSSKKKKSLQDEGSDTKFSYQRLPWTSCKVKNANIGNSFFLTNKINLTMALC